MILNTKKCGNNFCRKFSSKTIVRMKLSVYLKMKNGRRRGVVGDNGNYQVGAYADMHCTKVLSGRQKVQKVGFSNLITKSNPWAGKAPLPNATRFYFYLIMNKKNLKNHMQKCLGQLKILSHLFCVTNP